LWGGRPRPQPAPRPAFRERGFAPTNRVFGDNGGDGLCGLWHGVRMNGEQVIAKLREYEPELKAAGVAHLFLHGSYARGTAVRDVSDVDVIAEFDRGRRLSLLDMVAIENRLADVLGVRVDLSPANTLKEPVRQKAAREAVLAF